ncbi:hypothetical protein ACPV5U_24505 [Vibrio mediterranei]
MKIKAPLFVLTSVLIAAHTSANEPTTQAVKNDLRVNGSGYTQIVVDTEFEQKYPLLKVMNIEFPTSIKYIGQALNYTLALSGYRLAVLTETDYQTLRLYSMKLPMVNRTFFRSTTLQILETLAGNGYVVDIDEVSRVVTISKVQG